MKFAVLFEDNPDSGDIRKQHILEHLKFLELHKERINAAGPLLDKDHTAAGGLWLVDSEDYNDVMQLVEQDPFWSTGLRQSVRILQWRQVFANGQTLAGI